MRKNHVGKRFFTMVSVWALLLVSVFNPAWPLFGIERAVAASQTISSSQLTVQVDDQFPRIVQYSWNANGAVLYGQEDALTQVKVNGTTYTPNVTFAKPNGSTAQYTLNVASLSVAVSVEIKVVSNTVDFRVTNIAENGSVKVNTFEIPNHNLLSVRSNQAGAAFAGSVMNTAATGNGDTFASVTGTPPVNSSPQSYLYAFLNTNQLAGGLWTNSVSENSESARVLKQTVSKSGYSKTGIWSGEWIYRANGMSAPDPELPEVKVAITPDANADSVVDWQDGAIAFRSIMNNPQGADKVPELVVQRIPMNFASQATNPFTKTLDETKRMYLATDGLGQYVLLKGYASEGHDSGHPDYGDIGKRQGGAADLNALVNIGHSYNGYFGVHINATESYPEAAAFNETLVNKNSPGWDWLDSSYSINKRYDATSGNRLSRLQSLKSQVPNLDFLYVDVWYTKGWDARQLAREIHSQGFAMGTEFPDDHEYDSIWSHWAVDYNYGGQNIKGYSSQIARFIRNHQKDTWVARQPLLGGTELAGYEGWQGRKSFDDTVRMTFETNLPTKYLQHFEIMKWTSNTIQLKNNVSVSNASGTRTIVKDGRTILNGNRYLLPWDPNAEEKLYHWNGSGGSSTWALPSSWSGLSTVKLYKLTDQGKVYVGDLPVSGGNITISSVANTAYVVLKGTAAATPSIHYGEGSGIADPGFNQGTLAGSWSVSGEGASVQRNANGDYELQIGSNSGTTSVSQTVSGLSAGSYAASVYVSTGGGRKAYLDVASGSGTASVYADSSSWSNYIAADAKSNSTMQRMYVYFDVPSGSSTAQLTLRTDAGSQAVTFDDVRIVKAVRPPNPNNAYFVQDFENEPSGLFPFIKGPAGGTNDPRVHLSQLHAPYTQKGWNGKAIDDVISGNWSLKAHKEAQGLLLQTIPQTLRFSPGVTYSVSFKYENETAGVYAFVIGDGTSVVSTMPFSAATAPAVFNQNVVGSSSGQTWIGIQKVDGTSSDFVLDDFVVNLGAGSGGLDPNQIPPSQMTATASSFQPGDEPKNAIDGNTSTLWHTKWDLSNPLPQSITLNLGDSYYVNQVKYLPRQTGTNGIITGYRILTSTDGTAFTQVAGGTWANDATEKSATFAGVKAGYVRLEATAGQGGFASAAEIKVFQLPRIKITKTDSRAITDLTVKMDFNVENAPHQDDILIGNFDQTTDVSFNARNGTSVNGVWTGDFLQETGRNAGPAVLTINKIETRPVANVTITVEFKIDGALHRDTHTLSNFDQSYDLTLTGQNGTYGNGVWVGDFLK